ncbi:MAG TPA: GNAT family N-acetyltransferase [Symbiobacteriaceae bacterium]
MTDIAIRALTPDLLEDYLSFFDQVDLADSNWSGCYCYFYHSPATSAEEWQTGLDGGNRAAVSDLIRQGVHRGFLAYANGRPVGWCHAAPRHTVRKVVGLLGSLYEPADDVGSIFCFVIAEPYRRQGISRQLLAAACDQFARDGLAFAEAYPGKATPSARHYRGPLPMYLQAGFVPVGEVEHYLVVRKPL